MLTQPSAGRFYYINVKKAPQINRHIPTVYWTSYVTTAQRKDWMQFTVSCKINLRILFTCCSLYPWQVEMADWIHLIFFFCSGLLSWLRELKYHKLRCVFPHCPFIFASDGLVTCGQLKTVSLCKMDFSPSNKNIDHSETLCDITQYICVSAELNYLWNHAEFVQFCKLHPYKMWTVRSPIVYHLFQSIEF